MRALFSLIGYVSTATLIAIAFGLGYLWHNGMLTNEKLFRMVAMVHDIDLEAIAEEEKVGERETPPEEVSLDDVSMIREVKLRDHEVKMNALTEGTQEFERAFRDINEGRQRFDRMAQELEERLQQEKELSSKENLNAVVNMLESIKPQEAKAILQMYLEDPDGERDVIILMKEMQPSKLQKVLQQFKTDADLKDLKKLQLLMLDGYPEGPEIDSMLERVRLLDDES
jgi:hypothetical protein